jgi:hypothetical protein
MFRPRCLLKRSANNNRRLKKRVSAVDSTPQTFVDNSRTPPRILTGSQAREALHDASRSIVDESDLCQRLTGIALDTCRHYDCPSQVYASFALPIPARDELNVQARRPAEASQPAQPSRSPDANRVATSTRTSPAAAVTVRPAPRVARPAPVSGLSRAM